MGVSQLVHSLLIIPLLLPALGRYPPSAVQTYTGDEGDPLMVPCLEVKSVPDATYAWALAETEEDESPKNLDQTERLVVDPRGKESFKKSDPFGLRYVGE